MLILLRFDLFLSQFEVETINGNVTFGPVFRHDFLLEVLRLQKSIESVSANVGLSTCLKVLIDVFVDFSWLARRTQPWPMSASNPCGPMWMPAQFKAPWVGGKATSST